MTPAQISTLRAACFADSAAAAFFAAPGDSAGLHAYLNAPSGSEVWRTDVPVDAILDAINFASYTPTETVTTSDTDPAISRKLGWLLTIQAKQMNLQLMLQGRDRLDCSRPQVRSGLRDAVIQVPSGTNAAFTAPGGAGGINVLNACVRSATRVETILASPSQASDTTGPKTARVATFEGQMDQVYATLLIYKDDGSIWTQ